MPSACFSASVIASALELRKASWFFLHSGLLGIDLVVTAVLFKDVACSRRVLPNGQHPHCSRITLVLYRTRPMIGGQVGLGNRVGRVRYNCLKEAARGRGGTLCNLNRLWPQKP